MILFSGNWVSECNSKCVISKSNFIISPKEREREEEEKTQANNIHSLLVACALLHWRGDFNSNWILSINFSCRFFRWVVSHQSIPLCCATNRQISTFFRFTKPLNVSALHCDCTQSGRAHTFTYFHLIWLLFISTRLYFISFRIASYCFLVTKNQVVCISQYFLLLNIRPVWVYFLPLPSALSICPDRFVLFSLIQFPYTVRLQQRNVKWKRIDWKWWLKAKSSENKKEKKFPKKQRKIGKYCYKNEKWFPIGIMNIIWFYTAKSKISDLRERYSLEQRHYQLIIYVVYCFFFSFHFIRDEARSAFVNRLVRLEVCIFIVVVFNFLHRSFGFRSNWVWHNFAINKMLLFMHFRVLINCVSGAKQWLDAEDNFINYLLRFRSFTTIQPPR